MVGGVNKRLLLRPWLKSLINKGHIRGLEWMDKSRGLFCIPWKHSGKQDWNPEQGQIFKEWAIHKGKFNDGDKPKYAKWKTNLRCALYKAEDILDQSKIYGNIKGTQSPYKIYQFLPKKKAQSSPVSIAEAQGNSTLPIFLVDECEPDLNITAQGDCVMGNKINADPCAHKDQDENMPLSANVCGNLQGNLAPKWYLKPEDELKLNNLQPVSTHLSESLKNPEQTLLYQSDAPQGIFETSSTANHTFKNTTVHTSGNSTSMSDVRKVTCYQRSSDVMSDGCSNLITNNGMPFVQPSNTTDTWNFKGKLVPNHLTNNREILQSHLTNDHANKFPVIHTQKCCQRPTERNNKHLSPIAVVFPNQNHLSTSITNSSAPLTSLFDTQASSYTSLSQSETSLRRDIPQLRATSTHYCDNLQLYSAGCHFNTNHTFSRSSFSENQLNTSNASTSLSSSTNDHSNMTHPSDSSNSGYSGHNMFFGSHCDSSSSGIHQYKSPISFNFSKDISMNNSPRHHPYNDSENAARIEVYYRSKMVDERLITNEKGCRLIHKILPDDAPEQIKYPLFGFECDEMDEIKMRPWPLGCSNDTVCSKATQILHNMQRGVLVKCCNGDIKVVRLCKTSLFYSLLSRQDNHKIERDEFQNATTIFKFKDYFEPAFQNYKAGKGTRPSDSVYIFFGQKRKGDDIDKVIIKVKITSCKASAMIALDAEEKEQNASIHLSNSDYFDQLGENMRKLEI